MSSEQILGRREDVAAILKALGIKEGGKPLEQEHKGWFSPREIIEVGVDGGKKRTQDGWIEYFNSQDKLMLSMPDLYHAGKSDNPDLLAALQKDFKDAWEVTSTRLIYQPDDLNGKVVHYFGSNVIEPVEMELEIPDYSSGNLVKDVLDDPIGLAFFQAICGAGDDKGTILETLTNLSGKGIDNLRVWTPSQEGRKEVPERRLLCGNNGSSLFHVYCDYDIDYVGRSSLVRR